MDSVNEGIAALSKVAETSLLNDSPLRQAALKKLTTAQAILSQRQQLFSTKDLQEMAIVVVKHAELAKANSQLLTSSIVAIIEMVKKAAKEADEKVIAASNPIPQPKCVPIVPIVFVKIPDCLHASSTRSASLVSSTRDDVLEEPPRKKPMRRIVLESASESGEGPSKQKLAEPSDAEDKTTASTSDSSDRPKRLAALKSAQKTAAATSSSTTKKPPGGPLNKRQLEKLEKELLRLSKKIVELQGQELSLDDLDDRNSSYVLTHKLQEKFMKVFRYIQHKQLGFSRSTPALLDRPVEKVLVYKGSKHSAINDEINRLLKKGNFPDYPDIMACVEKANEVNGLGLSRNMVESDAEKAFRDIGRHLQKRRRRDYIENFGSTYTDQANPGNDPAIQSPELNEKLKEQNEKGKKKMQDMIDSYALRQDNEPEEAEPEGDKEGEDAEEEEEEESTGEEEGGEDDELISQVVDGEGRDEFMSFSDNNEAEMVDAVEEQETEVEIVGTGAESTTSSSHFDLPTSEKN